jgi:hypothetical protein
MTYHIEIIQPPDFLRVTAAGEFDYQASAGLLKEIAARTDALGGNFEVVIDLRRANATLSATDLWYLAVELNKYHSAFRRKVAVLCPVERFDSAEFFALVARRPYRSRALLTGAKSPHSSVTYNPCSPLKKGWILAERAVRGSYHIEIRA